MYRDWKKMWPAATASLVAITSFLTAASEDAQMRNLENRVSALEQRKNANGVINPNGRPGVKDGADVFVTIDALYWRANVNGLDYAAQFGNCECGSNDSDSSSGSSSGSSSDSGMGNCFSGTGASFCQPKFKFAWGFRLGLGYNMPHDGWDLYLYWTRFHTNPQDTGSSCRGKCSTSCSGEDSEVSSSGSSSGSKVPLFVGPAGMLDGSFTYNDQTNPSSVTGRWKMNLDMLDLELGREFFTSKWLTLRPFVGVRASWNKQEMRTGSFGFTTTTPGSVAVPASQFGKQKVYSWGVGPRAGMNTNWGLGGGWSFYGNAAVALIYSHFNDTYAQCEDICATSTVSPDLKTTRKFFVARAIADLALGLRWGQSWCDDRYAVTFTIGWEEHFFFGQNQFVRFSDPQTVSSGAGGADIGGMNNVFTTNQGDLTLSGLTLGARFDF